MDLRLESVPFTFEGRTYELRCNMNVLADVQEMNAGRISPAFDGKRGQKTALQFLAAMMNDYADEQGWFDPDPVTGTAILAKPFTPRALGRAVGFYDLPAAQIMGLVTRALTPPTGANNETTGDRPENPGN